MLLLPHQTVASQKLLGVADSVPTACVQLYALLAEAFIYDTQTEQVTTAITVVASGPEMERMPRDEAIRRGQMVCDEAVAQYRVRREGVLIVPQLPAPSPAMLRYDLTGRLDAKAGRFARFVSSYGSPRKSYSSWAPV